MFVRELRGFLDVFESENFSCKIRFDDVLQSRHLRVIEKSAARANVRIDVACVGRVLPPVRELVAVGIQDRIESQRLNDLSPWRKRRKRNELNAMNSDSPDSAHLLC